METVCFSETEISIYWTTWCYIPKNSNICTHYCGNLKFHGEISTFYGSLSLSHMNPVNRLQFKICWKWVQGILHFHLTQEEDNIQKPIKWLVLKLGICDTGQLQDSTCSAVWSVKKKRMTAKFQRLKCKVNACRFMFSCSPYRSKLLDQVSVTVWE